MITDLLVPKSNPIVGAVEAKDKEVKQEKNPVDESDPGNLIYLKCIILYDQLYFDF